MPRRRTHPMSFLSYVAMAGAVMLAASALDRRMRPRRRLAQPDNPARPNDAPRPDPPHSGVTAGPAVAFSAMAAASAGARADRGTVRPAGRDAMRDPPESWDAVDEANDESFPASDPPGRY